MRILFTAVTLLFLIGCETPFYPIFQPNEEEEEIESIVFVEAIDLVQDQNGFYHLPMDEVRHQTLKRLDGYVYRNDKPMNVLKFGWYSLDNWNWDGYEIPVVNSSSYSREDGKVSTMIAPIYSMRYDTITIYVAWYDDWKSEEGYGAPIRIVLD